MYFVLVLTQCTLQTLFIRAPKRPDYNGNDSSIFDCNIKIVKLFLVIERNVETFISNSTPKSKWLPRESITRAIENKHSRKLLIIARFDWI